MPPFALHSHRIISATEGDNDALVSVTSAQWGQHLATWPADHFRAINRRFLPKSLDRCDDIIPRYLALLPRLDLDTPS